MNDHELETRLRTRYGVRANETEPAPLSLRLDVAAIARKTPATRRLFGRGRGMTLLAAAATVALVGGALAVGSGVLRQPAVVPPVTAPSLLALLSASPDATSPSPTESAPPSSSPFAASLNLVWKRIPVDEQRPSVAWVGDRFVLVDKTSRTVRTSTDGETWQAQPADPSPSVVDLLMGVNTASIATWQNDVVGWWNPQDVPDYGGMPAITARDRLEIVRPPAAQTESTPFPGRVESLGIGPNGIVASVMDNQTARVWASVDGVHWTESARKAVFSNNACRYPDAPDTDYPFPNGGFGQVTGVSDGFIASGCGTGMWYSPDGLTWHRLGTASDTRMLPFLGGALVVDGSERFDFWTSSGRDSLPMVADLPARTVGAGTKLATGPLGLVVVSKGTQKALLSPDGVHFGISPIPVELAQEGSGRGEPTLVVGDRSVLLLEEPERFSDPMYATPSLWLGTLQP